MTMWDALDLIPIETWKLFFLNQPFKASGNGLQGIQIKKYLLKKSYTGSVGKAGVWYFNHNQSLLSLSQQSRSQGSLSLQFPVGGVPSKRSMTSAFLILSRTVCSRGWVLDRCCWEVRNDSSKFPGFSSGLIHPRLGAEKVSNWEMPTDADMKHPEQNLLSSAKGPRKGQPSETETLGQ